MHNSDDWRERKPQRLGWSSALVFGFGLAVLVFLVAIERPNWFHIKPMTGAAIAMSYTATTQNAEAVTPATGTAGQTAAH